MRRRAAHVLALALVLACGSTGVEEEIPVLGAAPDFVLTDQDGARFDSDSLRGSLWVADFIFTRCTNVCPMLSGEMARLQTTLGEDPALRDVRLVSFSIDPDHDRPDVLRAYAERHGADTGRWIFATGGRDEMWKLSKDGFKLAVGEAPGEAGPLFHSDRLVVVDAAGRIRGYYSGLESEALARLRGDLRILAAEPGA